MNAKLTWNIYKPDGSPAKSPTSKSWARLKYQAHQPDCRSLFALKKHTIKFFGEDIPAFANGDPINDVKAGILSFTTAASVAVLETDRDAADVQPMEVDRMILAEAHQWAAAQQSTVDASARVGSCRGTWRSTLRRRRRQVRSWEDPNGGSHGRFRRRRSMRNGVGPEGGVRGRSSPGRSEITSWR